MKDKNGKKKKHKKMPWIIGGVVVLAGGGIVVSQSVAKAKAAVEDITGVQTADVEKRDLKETVSVAGTVESKNVSSLSCDVMDTSFTEVKVKVGDRVKKGDVIAVLDSAELEKSLAAAEKSLDNTKTKNEIDLENAEHGYETAVDSKTTVSGRTARTVSEAQDAYDEAVKKDNDIYTKYLNAFNQRVTCSSALDQAAALLNEASADVAAKAVESTAADEALKTAKSAYEQLIADGKKEDSEEAVAAKKVYDDASAAATAAAAALKESKDNYTALSGDYTDLTDDLKDAYTAEAELQAQLEMANAEVKAAAQALISAKEGKSDSDKELDNAVKSGEDNLTTVKIMIDENLSVPQNEIDRLNESISDCIITADMDGVITELNFETGDKYAGGVIAVIQDDSEFKVTSTVDQYDINKLTADLDTDISVNALGKDNFGGKLSFVAPTPKVNMDTTGTTGKMSTDYDIEVTFDQPVEGLRIGMSAKLTINIREKKDVLTVPAACVTKTADGSCTVEVQKDDGTTEKIDVETGMETSYFIEIISDKIKEGMKVVLPTQESDEEMFF